MASTHNTIIILQGIYNTMMKSISYNKILMSLLSLPQLMLKFRTGTCNGHWLLKSENVLHNKMTALGLGPPNSSKVSIRNSNIRHDIFLVPGFQHLNWLSGRDHFGVLPRIYSMFDSVRAFPFDFNAF